MVVTAYLLCLLAWFVVWQLVGDANWWLFTVNALAFYLFLPLLLALAAAAMRRNWPLVGGSLAGVVLFVVIWGGLFWPNGTPESKGPVLTVMTYNVLGHNTKADSVVEALRASDADIIGLSELNPAVAAAIDRELSGTYPYQLLEPEKGVHGGGVLSRLPFEVVLAELSDPQWVSPPTALKLQLDGSQILFVRVHSTSGAIRLEARERQARLLSDLAGELEMPLIVAGDFNASDINDSYDILTEHLQDAWREAGDGLGNTFPGASKGDTPGSSRPRIPRNRPAESGWFGLTMCSTATIGRRSTRVSDRGTATATTGL